MSGLLAAPFVDDDLTDKQKIVFSVGGGDLTATVALPVAGAGLDYGYYSETKSADDIAAAVATAMTAVDSETITASYNDDGLVTFTRGGGHAVTFVIKWTDAITTFEGEWIGYDDSSDTTGVAGADAVSGVWQSGRIFRPEVSITPHTQGVRQNSASQSEGGTNAIRRRNTWHTTDLEFDWIPGARVNQSYADSAAYVAALGGGIVAADPNVALESLWDWFDKRAPLRWTPDRDTLTTYSSLQIDLARGAEQLEGVRRIAEVKDSDRTPPFYRVHIRTREYVAPT